MNNEKMSLPFSRYMESFRHERNMNYEHFKTNFIPFCSMVIICAAYFLGMTRHVEVGHDAPEPVLHCSAVVC